MIINVKYISLVNILSGRGVVRELLQADASPEKIVQELRRISDDSAYRGEMVEAFRVVREMFSGRNASARVADIAIGMAGWK